MWREPQLPMRFDEAKAVPLGRALWIELIQCSGQHPKRKDDGELAILKASCR